MKVKSGGSLPSIGNHSIDLSATAAQRRGDRLRLQGRVLSFRAPLAGLSEWFFGVLFFVVQVDPRDFDT